MYDHYIELNIEGVTRGRDLQHAFILILQEKGGQRLYPILLEKEGYDQVEAALIHKDYTCSRLMNQLANRVGMTMLGVRILLPHNGRTQALLDFELINEVVSITVSAAEATIAALETKCSFWIEPSRLDIQSKTKHDEGQMALSLYAMNEKLLEEALESAVEEDHFELAAVLRDELKRRKQSLIEDITDN